MNANPIILAIPVYFLLILIELVIQSYSKRKLYRLNDALSNISCGIVQQLTGLGFKVLSITAFVVIFEEFRIFTIEPTLLSGIILFIAADFCYYWAHRYSHEINLFWGGHVVHHQSEEYNFSVALRQGSFQVIWTFVFYLPLAVLGFDPTQFIFMSALVTVYQFWIHTETIGKLGWFEIIFNTPSHHRVHHGRDPKYIDKNHAGVFIIWDKIFGTFQKEEEKPIYGITRPLNSFNPLWANFDHYVWMWENFNKISGVKNKLKFIFAPPGWFPEEMGGYQAPQKVDKSQYSKYDITIRGLGPSYLLFQYIFVLVVASLFLFQVNTYSFNEKVFAVFYIIWAVVNLGGLSEIQKWSIASELIRWIITILMALPLIMEYTNINFLNHYTYIGWATFSIIFFLWVIKSIKNQYS